MFAKMKVLMVGPDRSVQGGISGVVNNYYEAGLDKKIELKYIGTMVDGSKLRKLLKAMESYVKFLFSVNKYDIVHVNMAADASYYRKLYFIYFAKLFRKKLIIHQHGGDVENFFDKSVCGKKRKIRYQILNRADAFLVLAPIWKDFFSQILPDDKIYVLPNGIEVPLYQVEHKDYSNHNIAFIGRICFDKGIQELFAAVQILKKEYPDIHLYLGGKWEDDSLQIQQESAKDCISYLGWLDTEKKRELLEKCSIFAMPSYFEGQCIAVLEAMSYGCATIATRVGGLQQTFCDKQDGILIAPGNTEELVQVLQYLLSHDSKKKEIGAAGRKKVELQFDIQVIMNRLLDIYQMIE